MKTKFVPCRKCGRVFEMPATFNNPILCEDCDAFMADDAVTDLQPSDRNANTDAANAPNTAPTTEHKEK